MIVKNASIFLFLCYCKVIEACSPKVMLYDSNKIKLFIDFPLTAIIQPGYARDPKGILNSKSGQLGLNFEAVYASSTIVIAVGQQMASLSIGRLRDHPIENYAICQPTATALTDYFLSITLCCCFSFAYYPLTCIPSLFFLCSFR